jgi:hypothetical protein
MLAIEPFLKLDRIGGRSKSIRSIHYRFISIAKARSAVNKLRVLQLIGPLSGVMSPSSSLNPT